MKRMPGKITVSKVQAGSNKKIIVRVSDGKHSVTEKVSLKTK